MDESTKQRAMLGVIAFNLTVLFYQVVFNMGQFGFPFTWTKLLLGIVLAAVVGGATFAIAQFLQR